MAVTQLALERKELRGRCNLVIGNHSSFHGIGEILHTLISHLSRRYRVTISVGIAPNQTNLLIDEFSIAGTVDYMREIKRSYPRTKFVLIATEFVTALHFCGIRWGTTFNYFSLLDDRRYAAAVLAYALRLKSIPPYMHRRYLGYLEALSFSDLVLSLHPGIANSLNVIPKPARQPIPAPLTIYPEIDVERLRQKSRLEDLSVGFVMSGTLTRFRRQEAKELCLSLRKAGIDPVYRHLPFKDAPGVYLENGEVVFESAGAKSTEYLFNLNPPQRENWAYSSPMRILRAILLGQIPVVTKKFGDHELESVAVLWRPDREAVRKLWIEAAIGREFLIDRHLQAVAEYNAIAQTKNQAISRALDRLVLADADAENAPIPGA